VSTPVAILGGSTPFTAALVEALRAAAPDLPRYQLRLLGTDAVALDRMQRYSALRLRDAGWTVSSCTRLEEALDGVAVVVNQIRFGGLSARARDEAMAERWHVPADETLGPCGLAAALRTADQTRELGAQLGRRCPDAWVLNLSNPLSVTTALLGANGAPARTVGLCELPLSTAAEVCRVLRCSVDDVDWEYAGLNHRGVIFSFRHRGEELLPQLPDLLAGETIFGITADEIRQIGALPLKYFKLTRAGATSVRRAGFLISLKTQIAVEIDRGEAPPPSLQRRAFDWYSAAVVPALAAISSDVPRRIVVNVPGDDGLVREVAATVSRAGFDRRNLDAPGHLTQWLRRWDDHERAVLEAVTAPSAAKIERALELDPIVPLGRAPEIAREIWMDHAQ
jgi:6-phospho-beta-glucosidase